RKAITPPSRRTNWRALTIFFQKWRGQFQYFEFDHVNRYADQNGVWEWHEAPVDEFRADIRPGQLGTKMQLPEQPLIARAEEYVFRLSPALVISGKVIDALTRQQVREFRVVPGGRIAGNQDYWAWRGSFVATGGRYEIREDRPWTAFRLRIEADGYRAAVSRDIKSDEGTITIDFALERGNNVLGKVVTPGLLPAVGARVALGGSRSWIRFTNGEIDDRSNNSPRETTDRAGRFHFPAQDKDFQLVITHPSGFAQIKSKPEWDLTRIIRLEPWSRVEGTLRVGPKPARNATIHLQYRGAADLRARDAEELLIEYRTKTGPDGRFVFERVVPAKWWISRDIAIMCDQGDSEVSSSCNVPFDILPETTVHLALGGNGRSVVGKLRPPPGPEVKVRWSFAEVIVTPHRGQQTATDLNFNAAVGRDGTFRIDDVPEGDYLLTVFFLRIQAGFLHNHRFHVPPRAGPEARPVDLGTLTLEKP
ncbi:MAG: hypothetical protein ACP5XB_30220, partial [Isosphaeraceae bacterium]